MPSLNSNKTNKFEDIIRAEPAQIRIIYENGLRYILTPFQNYWYVLNLQHQKTICPKADKNTHPIINKLCNLENVIIAIDCFNRLFCSIDALLSLCPRT